MSLRLTAASNAASAVAFGQCKSVAKLGPNRLTFDSLQCRYTDTNQDCVIHLYLHEVTLLAARKALAVLIARGKWSSKYLFTTEPAQLPFRLSV